MPKTAMIFAIYSTKAAAQTGVDALVNASFSLSDISVLSPGNIVGPETATQHESTSQEPAAQHVAGARGVLRGAIDVLAGLGMLAIPGIGPMVGESTLKAGLAGLGVDGAVGDVAQALMHIGIPELEAKRYEDRLERGAVLLAMRYDSELFDYIKTILKRTGAEDVCSTPAPSPEASSDTAQKAARR